MTRLAGYKRIVVKIGSALLVEDGELRRAWLTRLCSDIADLKAGGTDIVVVSSGAVALGCRILSMDRSKLSLVGKQACAAAGQSALTRAYDDALGAFALRSAQALLTLEDTENRRRWLNARSTLSMLIELGVVPVVNENDTVATEEIRYGDNDRLAARTAQMVGADLLILLSDIDGLYTSDPRREAVAASGPASRPASRPDAGPSNGAKHVAVVSALTPDILAMGGDPNPISGVGSGGMATKLLAAKICMASGCDMMICDGKPDNALARLDRGVRHTLFRAADDPESARAQWIRGSLSPSGRLVVDRGAYTALQKGRSLLAAGLTSLSGHFGKGDTVSITTSEGTDIALGLSSYDAADLGALCGLRSEDIDHPNGPVVVHRDNMVML